MNLLHHIPTFLLSIAFCLHISTDANAQDEAYKLVDEFPLYGKCKTKECSDTKLIKFLSKNLKYPKQARKK